MKVVGLLTYVAKPGEPETFAIINPERVILLMPPDECPADWQALMRQAQEANNVEVLGIIVDFGEAA